MTPVEKIKELYSSPYDVKKLGEYQKIMMGSVEDFEEVMVHIDSFDRNTDTFLIITKYHIESHQGSDEYKKLYEKVVEKVIAESKRSP